MRRVCAWQPMYSAWPVICTSANSRIQPNQYNIILCSHHVTARHCYAASCDSLVSIARQPLVEVSARRLHLRHQSTCTAQAVSRPHATMARHMLPYGLTRHSLCDRHRQHSCKTPLFLSSLHNSILFYSATLSCRKSVVPCLVMCMAQEATLPDLQ